VVIALDKKWIWDSWYVRNGDDWHGYFLQADKSLIDPELRHWNVTQGHAVSKDLTNWTHLGTTFAPSQSPAWDDFTTWTGSVIQGPDGIWHLFYTGTTRAEDGMKQRIGHATSTDMHNWVRVGNGQCLDISGPDYEEYSPGHWHDRACRDPWVMKDPDGDGWLMYFTARVPGIEEPNAGGSIGFATSPDLNTWTIQPPVYRGGTFGQLEVPQVFEKNGKWYCLFCTSSSHWSEAYKAFNPQSPVTGTHYLIADHPRGPWAVAPGDFLDGAEPCKRYAARIVDTGEALYILGFMANPEGTPFIGAVSDPDLVVVDGNGLLKVV
jgi:beta-fructofuranosidase